MLQENFVDIPLIFILTFQIFAILNPLSVIPTYLVLTEQFTLQERHSIVIKAIIVVLIIGTLVLAAGDAFLTYIGVSIYEFRFAGGILLLISAIDMFSGFSRAKRLDDPLSESITKSKREEQLTELAAVPLATPLLLGPGTITFLLTISVQYSLFNVFISMVLATLLSGLILAISTYLLRILHESSIKVLGRLMALVVAAIAVKFIHAALFYWGIATT